MVHVHLGPPPLAAMTNSCISITSSTLIQGSPEGRASTSTSVISSLLPLVRHRCTRAWYVLPTSAVTRTLVTWGWGAEGALIRGGGGRGGGTGPARQRHAFAAARARCMLCLHLRPAQGSWPHCKAATCLPQLFRQWESCAARVPQAREEPSSSAWLPCTQAPRVAQPQTHSTLPPTLKPIASTMFFIRS